MGDKMDNRVGKRIQQYREKAGISQEQLAETVDISVTAISNIERGINYPTFENFLKIVKAIGASADLILVDVIPSSYVSKACELSDMLETTTPEKRNQIFAVIETLLNS